VDVVTDEERLAEIAKRADATPSGPWKSWIEGRDHVAGDSFIQTAGDGPDIYTHASFSSDVDVDERLRTYDAVQDFVAAVRQDVPWLIERVRALTAERDELIVERDAWKTRVTG
jgi:hypothetical protein